MKSISYEVIFKTPTLIAGKQKNEVSVRIHTIGIKENTLKFEKRMQSTCDVIEGAAGCKRDTSTPVLGAKGIPPECKRDTSTHPSGCKRDTSRPPSGAKGTPRTYYKILKSFINKFIKFFKILLPHPPPYENFLKRNFDIEVFKEEEKKKTSVRAARLFKIFYFSFCASDLVIYVNYKTYLEVI